jgi:glycosyltransferase involved in cell wall biosynthesis
MKQHYLLPLISILFLNILAAQQSMQPEQLLVAIIPTYENKARAFANLSSILAQDYANWYGIIILDNPQDGTIELYRELLPQLDREHKFKLIVNDKRYGPLRNHWVASHTVPDEAIIVNIDGDDALPHTHVFSIINQKYTPEVWATWGSYRSLPGNTPGHCRAVPHEIIDHNKWRELPLPFCTSHLRTFRASLFKQVKLQDLTYKGNFWPCAGDIAFFWPILEMAGHHAHYCPEYLYEYWETDINEYKVRLPQVLSIYNYIRTLPPYLPLAALPQSPAPSTVDMIIFSYKRPLQLYALLESIEHNMRHLEAIHVLYRAGGERFENAYTIVQEAFPQVHFVQQSEHLKGTDFQPLLKEILQESTQPYIMFAVDDIIVTDPIDCKVCVNALQKTHAHGFFLRLGTQLTHSLIINAVQSVPPLVEVEPDLYAWHFRDGMGDWAYPNSVDMVIYPKEWVVSFAHTATFSNPSTLEAQWFSAPYVNLNAMGICHKHSKLVNIPLNVVQTVIGNPHMNIDPHYLLDLFERGHKIDIQLLAGKMHPSVHTPYCLEYIRR